MTAAPDHLTGRAPEAGKTVGSVASGMRVLRHLSQVSHPMRGSEIARELHLNPSTCLGILRTLVQQGVVAIDTIRKTYSLGSGALVLAPAGRLREADIMVLKPAMERLAATEGVLVTLWKQDGDEMALLLSAEPDLPLGIGIPPGCRLPLYIGAAGRMIAAQSQVSLAELHRRYQELRWQRPPTFRRYVSEIEQAREKGWTLDAGDYVRGILSISAPVRLLSGAGEHACSATMFLERADGRQIERIAAGVIGIGRQTRPG